VGAALQEAFEAIEELLHEILRMPLRVGEEHMIGIDDGGEEAGWIRAEVASVERTAPFASAPCPARA
jgi:hypothetical protein